MSSHLRTWFKEQKRLLKIRFKTLKLFLCSGLAGKTVNYDLPKGETKMKKEMKKDMKKVDKKDLNKDMKEDKKMMDKKEKKGKK
jgi:hypothetical protein